MIRSGLIEQAGAEWTTLLPGIMLTLNAMPQENHGYTATQAMWGKELKLPVELIWPKKERGYREVSECVRNMQKSFKEIKQKIAPHNMKEPTNEENPFKEGDRILVFQQAVDRDHKFSPKWKGPLTVTKIVNQFQVEYEEGETRKRSNIRYCKKYREEYEVDAVGVRQTRQDERTRDKKGRSQDVRVDPPKDDTFEETVTMTAWTKVLIRIGKQRRWITNLGDIRRLLKSTWPEDAPCIITGQPSELGRDREKKLFVTLKGILGGEKGRTTKMAWGKLKAELGDADGIRERTPPRPAPSKEEPTRKPEQLHISEKAGPAKKKKRPVFPRAPPAEKEPVPKGWTRKEWEDLDAAVAERKRYRHHGPLPITPDRRKEGYQWYLVNKAGLAPRGDHQELQVSRLTHTLQWRAVAHPENYPLIRKAMREQRKKKE